MLERIVSEFLTSYLGEYFEDIDTEQVKVSFWRGKVNLKNLRVRKDVLRFFDTPLCVASGEIAELVVSIPWAHLTSESVVLTMRDVRLVLQLKNLAGYDAAQDDLEGQQRKQRELDDFEQLLLKEWQDTTMSGRSRAGQVTDSDAATAGNASMEAQSDTTFVARMRAAIVQNIRVTMEDIHLEYQCVVPDTHSSFSGSSADLSANNSAKSSTSRNVAKRGSLTLHIEQLKANACNAQYEPTFAPPRQRITYNQLAVHNMYMTVKIERDGFYQAYEYKQPGAPGAVAPAPVSSPRRSTLRLPDSGEAVLSPLNVVALIQYQPIVYETGIPQCVLGVHLDTWYVQLDDAQWSLLLSMAHDILVEQVRSGQRSGGSRGQRLLRPRKGIRPTDDPRAWWMYATQSVLREIHASGGGTERRTGTPFSWRMYQTIKEMRVRYTRLYMRARRTVLHATAWLDALTPAEESEVAYLEEVLPTEALKLSRRTSLELLQQERAEYHRIRRQQHQQRQQQQSTSSATAASKASKNDLLESNAPAVASAEYDVIDEAAVDSAPRNWLARWWARRGTAASESRAREDGPAVTAASRSQSPSGAKRASSRSRQSSSSSSSSSNNNSNVEQKNGHSTNSSSNGGGSGSKNTKNKSSSQAHGGGASSSSAFSSSTTAEDRAEVQKMIALMTAERWTHAQRLMMAHEFGFSAEDAAEMAQPLHDVPAALATANTSSNNSSDNNSSRVSEGAQRGLLTSAGVLHAEESKETAKAATRLVTAVASSPSQAAAPNARATFLSAVVNLSHAVFELRERHAVDRSVDSTGNAPALTSIGECGTGSSAHSRYLHYVSDSVGDEATRLTARVLMKGFMHGVSMQLRYSSGDEAAVHAWAGVAEMGADGCSQRGQPCNQPLARLHADKDQSPYNHSSALSASVPPVGVAASGTSDNWRAILIRAMHDSSVASVAQMLTQRANLRVALSAQLRNSESNAGEMSAALSSSSVEAELASMASRSMSNTAAVVATTTKTAAANTFSPISAAPVCHLSVTSAPLDVYVDASLIQSLTAFVLLPMAHLRADQTTALVSVKADDDGATTLVADGGAVASQSMSHNKTDGGNSRDKRTSDDAEDGYVLPTAYTEPTAREMRHVHDARARLQALRRVVEKTAWLLHWRVEVRALTLFVTHAVPQQFAVRLALRSLHLQNDTARQQRRVQRALSHLSLPPRAAAPHNGDDDNNSTNNNNDSYGNGNKYADGQNVLVNVSDATPPASSPTRRGDEGTRDGKTSVVAQPFGEEAEDWVDEVWLSVQSVDLSCTTANPPSPVRVGTEAISSSSSSSAAKTSATSNELLQGPFTHPTESPSWQSIMTVPDLRATVCVAVLGRHHPDVAGLSVRCETNAMVQLVWSRVCLLYMQRCVTLVTDLAQTISRESLEVLEELREQIDKDVSSVQRSSRSSTSGKAATMGGGAASRNAMQCFYVPVLRIDRAHVPSSPATESTRNNSTNSGGSRGNDDNNQLTSRDGAKGGSLNMASARGDRSSGASARHDETAPFAGPSHDNSEEKDEERGEMQGTPVSRVVVKKGLLTVYHSDRPSFARAHFELVRGHYHVVVTDARTMSAATDDSRQSAPDGGHSFGRPATTTTAATATSGIAMRAHYVDVYVEHGGTAPTVSRSEVTQAEEVLMRAVNGLSSDMLQNITQLEAAVAQWLEAETTKDAHTQATEGPTETSAQTELVADTGTTAPLTESRNRVREALMVLRRAAHNTPCHRVRFFVPSPTPPPHTSVREQQTSATNANTVAVADTFASNAPAASFSSHSTRPGKGGSSGAGYDNDGPNVSRYSGSLSDAFSPSSADDPARSRRHGSDEKYVDVLETLVLALRRSGSTRHVLQPLQYTAVNVVHEPTTTTTSSTAATDAPASALSDPLRRQPLFQLTLSISAVQMRVCENDGLAVGVMICTAPQLTYTRFREKLHLAWRAASCVITDASHATTAAVEAESSSIPDMSKPDEKESGEVENSVLLRVSSRASYAIILAATVYNRPDPWPSQLSVQLDLRGGLDSPAALRTLSSDAGQQPQSPNEVVQLQMNVTSSFVRVLELLWDGADILTGVVVSAQVMRCVPWVTSATAAVDNAVPLDETGYDVSSAEAMWRTGKEYGGGEMVLQEAEVSCAAVQLRLHVPQQQMHHNGYDGYKNNSSDTLMDERMLSGLGLWLAGRGTKVRFEQTRARVRARIMLSHPTLYIRPAILHDIRGSSSSTYVNNTPARVWWQPLLLARIPIAGDAVPTGSGNGTHTRGEDSSSSSADGVSDEGAKEGKATMTFEMDRAPETVSLSDFCAASHTGGFRFTSRVDLAVASVAVCLGAVEMQTALDFIGNGLLPRMMRLVQRPPFTLATLAEQQQRHMDTVSAADTDEDANSVGHAREDSSHADGIDHDGGNRVRSKSTVTADSWSLMAKTMTLKESQLLLPRRRADAGVTDGLGNVAFVVPAIHLIMTDDIVVTPSWADPASLGLLRRGGVEQVRRISAHLRQLQSTVRGVVIDDWRVGMTHTHRLRDTAALLAAKQGTLSPDDVRIHVGPLGPVHLTTRELEDAMRWLSDNHVHPIYCSPFALPLSSRRAQSNRSRSNSASRDSGDELATTCGVELPYVCVQICHSSGASCVGVACDVHVALRRGGRGVDATAVSGALGCASVWYLDRRESYTHDSSGSDLREVDQWIAHPAEGYRADRAVLLHVHGHDAETTTATCSLHPPLPSSSAEGTDGANAVAPTRPAGMRAAEESWLREDKASGPAGWTIDVTPAPATVQLHLHSVHLHPRPRALLTLQEVCQTALAPLAPNGGDSTPALRDPPSTTPNTSSMPSSTAAVREVRVHVEEVVVRVMGCSLDAVTEQRPGLDASLPPSHAMDRHDGESSGDVRTGKPGSDLLRGAVLVDSSSTNTNNSSTQQQQQQQHVEEEMFYVRCTGVDGCVDWATDGSMRALSFSLREMSSCGVIDVAQAGQRQSVAAAVRPWILPVASWGHDAFVSDAADVSMPTKRWAEVRYGASETNDRASATTDHAGHGTSHGSGNGSDVESRSGWRVVLAPTWLVLPRLADVRRVQHTWAHGEWHTMMRRARPAASSDTSSSTTTRAPTTLHVMLHRIGVAMYEKDDLDVVTQPLQHGLLLGTDALVMERGPLLREEEEEEEEEYHRGADNVRRDINVGNRQDNDRDLWVCDGTAGDCARGHVTRLRLTGVRICAVTQPTRACAEMLSRMDMEVRLVHDTVAQHDRAVVAMDALRLRLTSAQYTALLESVLRTSLLYGWAIPSDVNQANRFREPQVTSADGRAGGAAAAAAAAVTTEVLMHFAGLSIHVGDQSDEDPDTEEKWDEGWGGTIAAAVSLSLGSAQLHLVLPGRAAAQSSSSTNNIDGSEDVRASDTMRASVTMHTATALRVKGQRPLVLLRQRDTNADSDTVSHVLRAQLTRQGGSEEGELRWGELDLCLDPHAVGMALQLLYMPYARVVDRDRVEDEVIRIAKDWQLSEDLYLTRHRKLHVSSARYNYITIDGNGFAVYMEDCGESVIELEEGLTLRFVRTRLQLHGKKLTHFVTSASGSYAVAEASQNATVSKQPVRAQIYTSPTSATADSRPTGGHRGADDEVHTGSNKHRKNNTDADVVAALTREALGAVTETYAVSESIKERVWKMTGVVRAVLPESTHHNPNAAAAPFASDDLWTTSSAIHRDSSGNHDNDPAHSSSSHTPPEAQPPVWGRAMVMHFFAKTQLVERYTEDEMRHRTLCAVSVDLDDASLRSEYTLAADVHVESADLVSPLTLRGLYTTLSPAPTRGDNRSNETDVAVGEEETEVQLSCVTEASMYVRYSDLCLAMTAVKQAQEAIQQATGTVNMRTFQRLFVRQEAEVNDAACAEPNSKMSPSSGAGATSGHSGGATRNNMVALLSVTRANVHLINDVARVEVPLFHLQLRDATTRLTRPPPSPSRSVSMHAGAVMGLNQYDVNRSVWVPVVDPVSVSTDVQLTTPTAAKPATSLSSPSSSTMAGAPVSRLPTRTIRLSVRPVKLYLTPTLLINLDTLWQLSDRFQSLAGCSCAEVTGMSPWEQESYTEYKIRQYIGLPMRFSFAPCGGEAQQQQQQQPQHSSSLPNAHRFPDPRVLRGASEQLEFNLPRLDGRELSHEQRSVIVELPNVSSSASADAHRVGEPILETASPCTPGPLAVVNMARPGRTAVPLAPQSFSLLHRHPLVEVRVRHGQRLVTFRTHVRVRNALPWEVQLGGGVGRVAPNATRAVEASLLMQRVAFRPAHEGDYSLRTPHNHGSSSRGSHDNNNSSNSNEPSSANASRSSDEDNTAEAGSEEAMARADSSWCALGVRYAELPDRVGQSFFALCSAPNPRHSLGSSSTTGSATAATTALRAPPPRTDLPVPTASAYVAVHVCAVGAVRQSTMPDTVMTLTAPLHLRNGLGLAVGVTLLTRRAVPHTEQSSTNAKDRTAARTSTTSPTTTVWRYRPVTEFNLNAREHRGVVEVDPRQEIFLDLTLCQPNGRVLQRAAESAVGCIYIPPSHVSQDAHSPKALDQRRSEVLFLRDAMSEWEGGGGSSSSSTAGGTGFAAQARSQSRQHKQSRPLESLGGQASTPQLTIRLAYDMSGGVTLWCPYWIVNKVPLPVQVVYDTRATKNMNAAAERGNGSKTDDGDAAVDVKALTRLAGFAASDSANNSNGRDGAMQHGLNAQAFIAAAPPPAAAAATAADSHTSAASVLPTLFSPSSSGGPHSAAPQAGAAGGGGGVRECALRLRVWDRGSALSSWSGAIRPWFITSEPELLQCGLVAGGSVYLRYTVALADEADTLGMTATPSANPPTAASSAATFATFATPATALEEDHATDAACGSGSGAVSYAVAWATRVVTLHPYCVLCNYTDRPLRFVPTTVTPGRAHRAADGTAAGPSAGGGWVNDWTRAVTVQPHERAWVSGGVGRAEEESRGVRLRVRERPHDSNSNNNTTGRGSAVTGHDEESIRAEDEQTGWSGAVSTRGPTDTFVRVQHASLVPVSTAWPQWQSTIPPRRTASSTALSSELLIRRADGELCVRVSESVVFRVRARWYQGTMHVEVTRPRWPPYVLENRTDYLVVVTPQREMGSGATGPRYRAAPPSSPVSLLHGSRANDSDTSSRVRLDEDDSIMTVLPRTSAGFCFDDAQTAPRVSLLVADAQQGRTSTLHLDFSAAAIASRSDSADYMQDVLHFGDNSHRRVYVRMRGGTHWCQVISVVTEPFSLSTMSDQDAGKVSETSVSEFYGSLMVEAVYGLVSHGVGADHMLATIKDIHMAVTHEQVGRRGGALPAAAKAATARSTLGGNSPHAASSSSSSRSGMDSRGMKKSVSSASALVKGARGALVQTLKPLSSLGASISSSNSNSSSSNSNSNSMTVAPLRLPLFAQRVTLTVRLFEVNDERAGARRRVVLRTHKRGLVIDVERHILRQAPVLYLAKFHLIFPLLEVHLEDSFIYDSVELTRMWRELTVADAMACSPSKQPHTLQSQSQAPSQPQPQPQQRLFRSASRRTELVLTESVADAEDASNGGVWDDWLRRDVVVRELTLERLSVLFSLYRSSGEQYDLMWQRLSTFSFLIRSAKDATLEWPPVQRTHMYGSAWSIGDSLGKTYEKKLRDQMLGLVYSVAGDAVINFVTSVIPGLDNFGLSGGNSATDTAATVSARRTEAHFDWDRMRHSGLDEDEETDLYEEGSRSSDTNSQSAAYRIAEDGSMTQRRIARSGELGPRVYVANMATVASDSKAARAAGVSQSSPRANAKAPSFDEAARSRATAMTRLALTRSWDDFIRTATVPEVRRWGALAVHAAIRNSATATAAGAARSVPPCQRCRELQALRVERLRTRAPTPLPHPHSAENTQPGGPNITWIEFAHHVTWDEFAYMCSDEEVKQYAALVCASIVGTPHNVVQI